MENRLRRVGLPYSWSEQDEDEPGWHGNLGEVSETDCLTEANKCGHWLIQSVELANQNVGRLGTLRKLLHEVGVLKSYNRGI